jgi:hypothetical protein
MIENAKAFSINNFCYAKSIIKTKAEETHAFLPLFSLTFALGQTYHCAARRNITQPKAEYHSPQGEYHCENGFAVFT